MFKFFKKSKKEKPQKLTPAKILNISTERNSFNEPLDKLDADGELPWGWIAHNKEFTDNISKEYSYFLQEWINSRNKSPEKLYSSLKSFVQYMEDVEKLCSSKGECFEFWFRETFSGKGYLKTRQSELKFLEENLAKLQSDYEHKQNELVNLKSKVIQFLINNDGILQSELRKQFDNSIHNEVYEVISELEKENKLNRVKSGRSYILRYKC